MKSKIFKVNLSTVQSNILMMYLDVSRVIAKEVQHRLASVFETDEIKVSVKASSRDSSFIRFVTYWEITDEDVKAAIKKIQYVIKEFDDKFNN
jgi:threonine aldolase